MAKTGVSAERFVRAWARATCVADVVRLTGLSRTWIKRRARQLRKAGVDLPKFTHPRVYNPSRLNAAYARERRAALAEEMKELEGVEYGSDAGVG